MFPRFVAVFALLIFLLSEALAEIPGSAQPDSGAVDGSKYSNAFFGFSYKIPDDWAVRSTTGRVPGGFLLLSLKRKQSPDPLSAMLISAAQVPPSYGTELLPFLLDRYRLTQSSGQGLSINGISTGKTRLLPGVYEPEVVSFGERTFYRIQFEKSGVSRMVVGTADKGYALIFELSVPQRMADETMTVFTDSLHTLTFKAEAAPQPRR